MGLAPFKFPFVSCLVHLTVFTSGRDPNDIVENCEWRREGKWAADPVDRLGEGGLREPPPE